MSDIDSFISAVQERPTLWDKRNKNYSNRLISHREWVDLARIIETTSEAAKKKWKNLRDTYMRECKKISKPRSGAGADKEPIYTGSWPYFERMNFLKVVVKPRETEGNIPIDDNQDQANKENVADTDATQDITDIDMTELSQISQSILQGLDLNVLIQTSAVQTPSQTTYTYIHTPTPASRSPSAQLPLPSAPAPLPPPQTASPSAQIPTPSPSPSVQLPASRTSSPLPGPSKRARKRNADLEAFIQIEKEKMAILRQDQKDSSDDDLLWFRSILPYLKRLPAIDRLRFRTEMQELLLSKLNSRQLESDN